MPWRLHRKRARERRARWAFGLAVFSWHALANGAPFELSWSAPEGCPSRETVVAATRARLGESGSDAAPELFVQGVVQRERRGFVVVLALRDPLGHPLGERAVHVERSDCKQIEEPTAVVLAMMIDVARPRLEAGVDPAEAAPAPSTGDATPAFGESSTLPEPRPPATRRRAPVTSPPAASPSRRFLVGVAGVASRGLLPDVGLGVGVRAIYAPSSTFVVGLEPSFEAGGAVRFGGGEVGFQLFALGASVGVSAVRTSRFELIPMLGARGGLLHTRPSGFRNVENETRATMLAGPRVLLRARLAADFYAELLPELELVLIRDRLQILDQGQLESVHRPSLVEGRLSLGVGYEFR